MAWGSPTIHGIVVGSTHKPDPAGTQQVHREEDHSTTRMQYAFGTIVYFFSSIISVYGLEEKSVVRINLSLKEK